MAQQLGSMALGSIVYCRENGVNTPFYVAKHDYESTLNGSGRTLLVRKDCYEKRKWHSSAVNAYGSSEIDAWLETNYKAFFDADVQSAMGTTIIRYTPGNGTTSISSMGRSVFLLSATELGTGTESYLNTEGEPLSSAVIVTLKIAYLNGAPCGQWTRSPYLNYTYYVWFLSSSSGASQYASAQATDVGVRPAFTLPARCVVDDSFEISMNQSPTVTASTTSLGIQNEPFAWRYTVSDAEGDPITVREYLDGSLVSTHSGLDSGMTMTFGYTNNPDNFRKILNGSHTLTVVPSDSYSSGSSRMASWAKAVYAASITLAEPLSVAGNIEAAILSVSGSIPADAAYKVEVTNNALDPTPVWQDCTEEVKAGENIVFENRTNANGAAFNFRISVSRGASETGGHIDAVRGAFQ